jgi:hypothetical protein
MAKDFLIRGNAKLSTIKKRFSELVPFLTLNFYTEEEIKKGEEGQGMVPIDTSKRISEVRTKKNSDEFKVVRQTKVGTIEKRLLKDYGLVVQICVKDADGQEYYTDDGYDDKTLAEMNKEMEARGQFVPYV